MEWFVATMRLLSPELEHLLPPLRSQDQEIEPMVYAHFMVPDYAWSYYVTEGERHGGDYTFFSFLLGGEDEKYWRWSTERLSDLERLLDGLVVRDETFILGRLTDVVVLPYNE